MAQYNYIVPANLQDFRLDKALSTLCLETSRSQIQKAIKGGFLSINGLIISNLSISVKENDVLLLTLQETVQEGIKPADIKLDIIYEDEDLIVINKAVGMNVHPGSGDYDRTLVNALLFHTNSLSDIGGEIRPGIVHRLDKTTSGLMVVAKNNKAHADLAAQIESRELIRKYKALVWGMIKPQNGTINEPLARSKLDRKKMTTVKIGGRKSITHYKTLEIFQGGLFSLVECKLETGRTHQIRVHLSHSGHSIVGDQTYGNNKRKISGCSEYLQGELYKFDHQALHSFYISFRHPSTNLVMEFEKSEPQEYTTLIEYIRRKEVT